MPDPHPTIGCLAGQKGDFTGQTLLRYTAEELSNCEIVGICLAQQEPNTKVFPDGITGLVLRRCALQNCAIPVGVTVTADCDTTRWKAFKPSALNPGGAAVPVQDLEVDALGKALVKDGKVVPMTPVSFTEAGLSTTPAHWTAVAEQLGED